MYGNPKENSISLLFMGFVLNVCISVDEFGCTHATMCVFSSEHNLECQTLISTLSETGSLCFPAAFTKLDGLQAAGDPPVFASYLPIGVIGLQMLLCLEAGFYVGFGHLNSDSHV